MIKIGATGYGNKFSFATKQNGIDKARALMNLCEQYKIPYGTYYYTQSITMGEQEQEIEFIVNVLAGMGELEYNVLGIAIDIENGPEGYCRMLTYANKSHGNRQSLTELKKDMMEKLREITGQEVIIYSNKNELQTIIDYKALSQEDLRRIWLVNHSSGGHIEGLKTMGILDNSSFWQIELDEELPGYGGIDISVMTIERYAEIMREAGLDKEIKYVYAETELEEER